MRSFIRPGRAGRFTRASDGGRRARWRSGGNERKGEPGGSSGVYRRQPSRIPSAAAVRASDDLKEVTVEILEVDAASAVVVIDLTWLLPRWIGPVGKFAFANPAENLVEFSFADQKG